MRPGPIKKLQSEPAQQERGATRNSLEQPTAKGFLAPRRGTPARQSEVHTSDSSTAVERKNDTGKPERKSLEREHAVRELRQCQPVTPASPSGDQPPGASPDGPDKPDEYEPLMKALRTTDRDFVVGLYQQLCDAYARGGTDFDIKSLFFTLGVIKDAKPSDHFVIMLAAQMAMVSEAMIKITGGLARGDLPPR